MLEVASRRFMSDGYDATSINAIVEEAGGSLTTAYRLFGNKEGLLRAVIDETSERLHADTFSADMLSRAPDQALPELSMRIMATAVSPPLVALRRLIIAEVGKMPGMSEVIMGLLRRRLFEPVERYLAEWDRRGVLRVPDVESAARQFVSLAKGRFEEECLIGAGCVTDARRAQATRENVALFLAFYRR
nr:TetR/AcrR family transcriptional regulator [Oleiagrimonas sp. C23AA]